jgi:hypothetical protein
MSRRSISAALARRPDEKSKASKRTLHGPTGPGRVEDSFAAFRHPVRLLVDGTLRSRKNELLQTHIEHGARRRSNVSGVLGSGKYNCYIFQGHDLNLMQVALVGYYFSGSWHKGLPPMHPSVKFEQFVAAFFMIGKDLLDAVH